MNRKGSKNYTHLVVLGVSVSRRLGVLVGSMTMLHARCKAYIVLGPHTCIHPLGRLRGGLALVGRDRGEAGGLGARVPVSRCFGVQQPLLVTRREDRGEVAGAHPGEFGVLVGWCFEVCGQFHWLASVFSFYMLRRWHDCCYVA